MRIPRYRIRTLMVVAAVVAVGMASVMAAVFQKPDETGPKMVLRQNYWVGLELQIEPFGWFVIALVGAAIACGVVWIAKSVRKG